MKAIQQVYLIWLAVVISFIMGIIYINHVIDQEVQKGRQAHTGQNYVLN